MSARVKARTPAPPRRRGRLFRIVKRLFKAAALAVFLAVVFSAGFIGLKCYSRRTIAQVTPADVQRASDGIRGYPREEASTFLTLPEWYIVYNTEEYARFIAGRNPSGFPYAGSVRQYWSYYGGACAATKGVYPFSAGNHLMLAVIGSSFTIEYVLKGLYENIVGRATEWIGGRDTPEDAFARRTAVEYGAFMHSTPWYQFPFFARVGQLWRDTPNRGPHLVRKWERRMTLTAEYGAKGVYGWLIGRGTSAAYAPEDLRVHAWIDNAGEAVFAGDAIRKVKSVGPRSFIVTIPRYEAFTGHARSLIEQGVRFLDIAGNDEILVTALAPAGLNLSSIGATVVLDEPVLTDDKTRRVGLAVAVRSLHEVVPRLQKNGATVEHIYDY